MAARWRLDHAISLSVADPEMPPALYNRVADNWCPLFAAWYGRENMADLISRLEMIRDESRRDAISLKRVGRTRCRPRLFGRSYRPA
jgi:hypothetical protein